MRTRLEALERSRSAFIANASHELRTPLTALGGYLELLTEGGLTEAERGEFLETMGEQVQRLTKLATDLLDLSRLDAGGFTVAHDELELGELAADCAREMQALAARRGSAVVVGAGPSRRSPAATRDGCSRCCACWSTTPCATRRRARRSRCAPRPRPGARASIVSDDGPGIPPELLERVFERFFRGPGAAARGIGPRARDRPRAGRAHGGPAARDERRRRHALHARAARPGRRGRARLHWVIRDCAGRPRGASSSRSSRESPAARWRWRCAETAASARTVVTTVVRGGGRRGFDPVALYAGVAHGVVTIEASFGVDDGDGGQRLRRGRRAAA